MTHRVFGDNLKEPVRAEPEFEVESFDPSERTWLDNRSFGELTYAVLAIAFIAVVATGIGAFAFHWFGDVVGLKK